MQRRIDSPLRSERGAAMVGVVWVIVLLVLLLAVGGGLYAVVSERAWHLQKIAAAEALAAQRETQFQAAFSQLAEVSAVSGFRVGDDPKSTSNPAEMAARLQTLRTNYGRFIGDQVTTLDRALEAMQTEIDDLSRLLGEAQQQATTAESERASAQQNMEDVSRQKDTAYADLEKQLSDERDRNSSQEAADKKSIEDLNRRLTDHEARARSEKEDLEQQIAALTADVRTRDGRIAELSKKVEIIRLPEEPDGAVIAVSSANTCYVDLGTKDLLRRGTRFKVFTYGKGGEMLDKGMIEVTSVEETMAEARVVRLADAFDPIARGDMISAPNYDPEMPREFVLVGRFPTGYSRAMVADRLRALGATVSDTVGPSTDFLVMGDSSAPAAGTEEDTGEEAEAEGAAEMKLAQLYRVQVVPVREILEFLRYD